MYGKTIVFTFLVLAAAPLAGGVAGHPAVADAIALADLWIAEQMAWRDVPGLSLGVVHDQEVVWATGYGFSDRATKTPATAATLYRIGSVTKLFTATAILQLRDRGKLRLDDPVKRHLSWFTIRSSFAEAPEITVRHLLTHTSGLPREAAFPYWTTHEFPSREEVITALPGQDAVYAPASEYKYSNLGMALLGEIVSAVSGEPFADYLREHVLSPLGMASTTAAPADEHHRRRATLYMRRMPDGSRGVFDYYETRALAPAANVVSSVDDLARFAALQFRDGAAGGAQILKGSTIREMHRVHWVYPSWRGGRGLGFAVSRRDGKTVVSHSGWVGGNRSQFLLVPAEKVAVVVMTNADDVSPSHFGYEIYDLLGPAIAAATKPVAQERRAEAGWRRYLGSYADPWAWEYEVMIVGAELVLYAHNYPPEDDAEDSVSRLEPVAEHTFRQSDGELVIFELDADGKVERVKRRYEYLYPVER